MASIIGAVAVAGAGLVASAGTPVSAEPTITQFTEPDRIVGPQGIAAGPDGALWFTNADDSTIGRITTGGAITQYQDPGIDTPFGIAAGPDGAMWFTNEVGNSIGRITTAGVVTIFHHASILVPYGITAGPDGAMWFANYGNGSTHGSIGRITMAGVVTNYTNASIRVAFDITAGPDGALWFTDPSAFGPSSIDRVQIDPDGTVTGFTRFDLEDHLPSSITPGPDGALWFTSAIQRNEQNLPFLNGTSVGRIETDGSVQHFPSAQIEVPRGITTGPDGALWFANVAKRTIGRITTAGAVTSYPTPDGSQPYEITAGPDGAMWFSGLGGSVVNDSVNRIGVALGPVNAVSQSFGAGGGTVSTGTNPTAPDPVATSVRVANAGTVSITEQAGSGGNVAGYALAGQRVDISAPVGEEDDPITIWFSLDGSVLAAAGVSASTAQVLRNGIGVPVCTDPEIRRAAANPCIFERTPLAGSGVRIGIYTVAASRWNFGRRLLSAPTTGVKVSDVTVTEKDRGTKKAKLTVTLSAKSTKTVSVSYATQNDTASAGSDYRPVSGRLTFRPNKTKLTVKVPVIGDTVREATQRFRVRLSNPTNAVVTKAIGVITVVDND